MRKIKLVLLGLIVMLVMTAFSVSAYEDTVDLDYEDETGIIVFPGNVTLEFSYSNANTDDPSSDITITYREYSSGANVTLFKFKSNNVEPVDYTFENETKLYIFNDTNTTSTMNIYINYTGITVPPSPADEKQETIDELLEQLEEKNSTIESQAENITFLEEQIEELEDEITLKQLQIQDLYETFDELNETADWLEERVGELNASLMDSINYTNALKVEKQLLVEDLQNTIDERNDLRETYNQVSDAWATGYTDPDTKEPIFYFNATWFLGGMGVTIIILLLLIFRFGLTRRPKTSLENQGYTEAQSWENEPEFSEVEKEILNPVKRESVKDVENKVDNLVNNNNIEKPKKNKTNWWNTPAGKARKKQLSEWAKEQNKKRKGAKSGSS